MVSQVGYGSRVCVDLSCLELHLDSACAKKHSVSGSTRPNSPTRSKLNSPTISLSQQHLIESENGKYWACRADWNDASNAPWPLNLPHAPASMIAELLRNDNNEADPPALPCPRPWTSRDLVPIRKVPSITGRLQPQLRRSERPSLDRHSLSVQSAQSSAIMLLRERAQRWNDQCRRTR